MIPLLIVDDEIFIRVGLKSLIPWQEHGFDLIGEAASGVEALELLRPYPYYIVLTDIRMPEMDGLALLQQIKASGDSAKVIILSNHNDFEYVQKALQCGASDYMLKLTMEPAELLAKLDRVKRELIDERQDAIDKSYQTFKMKQYGREVKENRLRDLLTQQCSGKEIREIWTEFDLPGLHDAYRLVYAVIDDYDQVVEHNTFKSERLLNYSVTNILQEIMKKYGKGELVQIDAGQYAILQERFHPVMPEEMGSAIATLLRLSLSMGISPECRDIRQVAAIAAEAARALEHRFYEGPGTVLWSERLQPFAGAASGQLWDAAAWERMLDRHQAADMIRALDDSVADLPRHPPLHPEAVRERWMNLLHMLGAYCKKHGGDLYSVPPYRHIYPHRAVRRAQSLAEIHQWFQGWIPIYVEYVKHLAGKRWKPEIQAIARNIRHNYHLPLKVPDLAKEAGFAPNYLSGLFKKETGETIIDYMTRVRLEKAREMLKDPAFKIYEISEKVGYADPNHFSKLFKKIEGMHPTEFRKLFLQRD